MRMEYNVPMVRGRDSRSNTSASADDETDLATDVVLNASRLLWSVSARSIALADESITMPQFRVLVLLSSRGSMNMSALTEHLGILRSTGTRTVDRLVAAGLVERQLNPASRREIVITLTKDGAVVVGRATQWRRREIAKIVARMPEQSQQSLLTVLERFNEAGGEPPANADVLAGADWI